MDRVAVFHGNPGSMGEGILKMSQKKDLDHEQLCCRCMLFLLWKYFYFQFFGLSSIFDLGYSMLSYGLAGVEVLEVAKLDFVV